MVPKSHLSFQARSTTPVRNEGPDGVLREARVWGGARLIKSLPKIISSAQLAKSDKKYLTRPCQDKSIPFIGFFWEAGDRRFAQDKLACHQRTSQPAVKVLGTWHITMFYLRLIHLLEPDPNHLSLSNHMSRRGKCVRYVRVSHIYTHTPSLLPLRTAVNTINVNLPDRRRGLPQSS